MLRSCFWAVAISASLVAPYHTQPVHAATPAQVAGTPTTSEPGNAGPAAQIAQNDPPGRGGGGGGGGFGGGAGFGAGAGMRAVGSGGGGSFTAGGLRTAAPGAGSRFAAPGAAGPRFAIPRAAATIGPGMVAVTPRIHARHGVQRLSGANFPRYRHRHRGYRYYHRGWWYALPWWIETDCGYWSNVCASQWGYDSDGYYSCMRSYGCY